MNKSMNGSFIPAILYVDVKLTNDVLSNERARSAAVENRRITHTCIKQRLPLFSAFSLTSLPLFFDWRQGTTIH